jgi:hypothetical protein
LVAVALHRHTECLPKAGKRGRLSDASEHIVASSGNNQSSPMSNAASAVPAGLDTPDAGKDLNTLVIEAVEWRLALAEMSLRDIFAPVHENFRKSGITTDELDAILRKAIAAVRSGGDSCSG